MLMNELFENFSEWFFFHFHFLRFQKIQIYLEMFSARTYRVVIPTLSECHKAQLFWISLMLQLTFLQNYEIHFFHLGFNREPSTCTRVFLWKIIGFVPCVKFAGLISSTQVSMKTFDFWMIIRTKNHRFWSFYRNSDCPKKVLLVMIHLNIETHVSA